MPIPAILAGAAAGVGLVGGLKSLFSDSPDVPTMADVDLARDNPELWKELQRLQAMNAQLDALYAQRAAGPNYSERQGMAEALNNGNAVQASQGMLGSSVGAAQQADAEARLRANIAEKAFREQQMLQQQAQQGQIQYMNALNQGQQGVLQGLQGQANADAQGSAAGNQFFSGLFNAGVGGLAQAYNTEQLQNAYRPMASQNPYSSYYQAPTQGYGASFTGVPQGAPGWGVRI